MITTNGKLHIKRYMAGFVPAVAASIAYGIGGKANAVGDTRLHFEAGRVDVAVTSLDLINNKVIYKAALPPDFSGIIYELAIFNTSADTVAGEFGSRLVSTFDSESETWADPSTGAAPTYNSANSRIGGDSIRHTPALSTSESDVLNQLSLDLSGYSGNDLFIFAYNVGNANTSNVKFRFSTDVSNYYEFSLGVQTAGYRVTEVAKSTAVATGTPSWDDINSIQVTTTSGAGGASQVDYDGIRIEDVDTINPDYVMVSRELQGAPFTKVKGKVQEFEFALSINV